ncbi:unnamed protein product [Bursaphelenchus xylophilus]|uniref:(pine wood nematode) hypothetical protein n=1 Tax=Bursaphelenchus xylophilus TaxID=6326 RepID=A0A1I7SCF3_BURXY|nr:unnamed protein product [Bursaphelenchus xylophilus]CAG9094216.1 unnamed protein product [Bursaphelenchus xylophilus]
MSAEGKEDGGLGGSMEKTMNWLNESVKKAHRRIPPDVFVIARRLAPLLLLLALLIYLLIGATAFLAFEHANHENYIKRFHLRLGANRKHASREITASLFNQTANMLVIVDKVNQARMEELLYRHLKVYESELPITRPVEEAWSFTNSLTYCWALLTTMGHGSRAPKTIGGQIFALFYASVGVPFYMGTIVVWAFSTLCSIKWVLRRKLHDKSINETHILFTCSAIYVWFLIAFSVILYSSAIPDSYFRSLYTAVLSAFTVQTMDYNDFIEFDKVVTLTCTGIALYLGAMVLLTAVGVYRNLDTTAKLNKAIDPISSEDIRQIDDDEEEKAVHLVHSESVKSAPGSVPQAAPRFQVIVDEAGESQLTKPATKSTTKKKTTFVKEVHHY